MYVMRMLYYDFDDCVSRTDFYISKDKKELLKLYLSAKKQFDYVGYKIKELTKSPYFIYTEYGEMY